MSYEVVIGHQEHGVDVFELPPDVIDRTAEGHDEEIRLANLHLRHFGAVEKHVNSLVLEQSAVNGEVEERAFVLLGE